MIYHSPIAIFFFFNDTATTEIYTLSLHDALPICLVNDVPLHIKHRAQTNRTFSTANDQQTQFVSAFPKGIAHGDRKSTRLNSSHLVISYAVFCLKKKKHHAYQIDRDIATMDSMLH